MPVNLLEHKILNTMIENQLNIHPIFVFLIIAVLFGLVGYGVYRAKFVAPKKAERIEKDVFTPYFNSLSAGRIDKAWQQYTSPAYKRSYPLEQFRKHWQDILKAKGKIIRHEIYNNESSYELAGSKKTNWVQYRLYFENQKAPELLFYRTITTKKGDDLIDAAGRRLQGNATILGQERITPEPW